MKKDKNFSNVINRLIRYYQRMDEIKESQLNQFDGLDYEILSGRNQLIVTSKFIMDNVEKKKCGQEFDNKNAYDNMREKVKNIIEAFESREIELNRITKDKKSKSALTIETTAKTKNDLQKFEKPQFFLFEYDERATADFLSAYLEITLAQNKDKKLANRYIKNDLNQKISVETDFNVINKVLKAGKRKELCVNFEYMMRNNDLSVRNLVKYSQEKAQQYVKRMYSFEGISPFARERYRLYVYKLMERTKAFLKNYAFKWQIENERKVEDIFLLWRIMLITLMDVIDQLLLGEYLPLQTVEQRCKKITNISWDKKYSLTKRDPYEDFRNYNFILYCQNQYLEELRIQIQRAESIKNLKPIKEEYLFTTKENRLNFDVPKEGNFSLVLNNMEKYNILFNLGKKVHQDTFKGHINFIIDNIKEFNQATGRSIDPDHDICVFRAFYRALYIGTQEDSTSKRFCNIWKKRTEEGVIEKVSEYMTYSNLLSCLIHFEYGRGKEHIQCKTRLMKSIYEVMNKVYIQLFCAYQQGESILDCYLELEEVCQRIFEILYEEETEDQCI